MRFQQLFDPTLSNPAQAGGLGSIAGALQTAPQYYQQMIASKFMNPLLQQELAQQQQRSLQMQAETPFAAQLAHNTALGMLPTSELAQMMENPTLLQKYPWMANQLAGFMNTQYGTSTPPASGTIPTAPSRYGATNPPTTPQNQPIPQSQQPTWYGGLGSAIGNIFKTGVQDVKNLGEDVLPTPTPSPIKTTNISQSTASELNKPLGPQFSSSLKSQIDSLQIPQSDKVELYSGNSIKLPDGKYMRAIKKNNNWQLQLGK